MLFRSALKIIGLCEAAGIQMVIGTDTESRLGVLPRLHVRAAIPSFDPWPSEVGFFQQLADDIYDGRLEVKDGCVSVPKGAGFGGVIDEKKLKKYRA